MITLEVLAGDKTGATFELDLPVLTLGRAPSNQVVLSDYHLSGEHGQIFREDDRYIYRDLKSTNGSRLRRGDAELPLDGDRWELPLEDNDVLELGSPTEPVLIRCRIRVDEDAREADRQEVVAQRTRAQ